ncbi:lysophospholipid acyltransferase family protein [Arcanobacterium hippocoleae]|uniref:lysophospholipid acyltransferase family protein n=1 Tax=Arcanobacterium hippocoleae TaxID=149017 RepID=UPI0033411638
MNQQLHPLDDYHNPVKRKIRKLVRSVLTRPAIKTLLQTKVEGKENADGLTGAFIVVGNHSSHLDAPMVFSLLPDQITANLATGAAADYFYRRRGISKLTSLFFNTYPVERSGKATKQPGAAVGMTGRLLRDGIPILLFPEGTRSRDGHLGQFKPGAAALAIKFNVPILPLAMTGGGEAMPVGASFPKLNHPEVAMYIGKPMWAEKMKLLKNLPAGFAGKSQQ